MGYPLNTFFGCIEIVLNRYLSREPAVLKLCERFSGRVLVFHFSDLNVDVSLTPDATGVHVTEAESDRADVRLSSDVGGFSRLLTAGERRQAVLDSDVVQVEGDVTLAEQFIRAVESARPDIEEILAPLAGDVVAGRVASQTRQLTGGGAMRRRLWAWMRWNTCARKGPTWCTGPTWKTG